MALTGELRDRIERWVLDFVDISEPAVAALLAGIDGDAILAEVKSGYSWTAWDKVTPINGVDPSLILNRSDYAGGEVLLIHKGGSLLVLQPHLVGSADPITADNIEAEAEKLISLFALEDAVVAVLSVVRERVADAGFAIEAVSPAQGNLIASTLTQREIKLIQRMRAEQR